MKNHQKIAEKMQNGDQSGVELRFFTGPDTDGPETELEECRIPAALEQLHVREEGAPLFQIRALRSATVPMSPPMVARWMDVFVDDVRVSRTDLLTLIRGESVCTVLGGGRFTLDAADQ